MKHKIIIFMMVFFTLISLFSQEYEIQRNQAKLRKGPGSFYPIVGVLEKGTKVEVIPAVKGWMSLEFQKETAFLSEKALKDKSSERSVFDKMAEQKTKIRISKMGITAGVKGFAGNFNEQIKGDPDALIFIFNYKINPQDYKKFRKHTYKKIKLKKLRKINPLPIETKDGYYSFSEEGLGLAIASKISKIGLIKNESKLEYLNYIGNLLVEASEVYDTGFKFFILDHNSINAYSCPGGIVFITSGLLQQLQSEAELAFILSHEIAHVARKHGMQEAESRKEHILADDLFMELDDELEQIGENEISETELELEELTVNIYETIFQGRLKDFEDEADELALLYMIRAGYDQKAAISILKRLSVSKMSSDNEHYTHEQITERLKHLKSKINQSKKLRLLINKRRFQENF
ncbi:MAG: M48 family metalloprotease [Candidatus Cloacimonetes bacterium]|nr:M48 family metalloprotease [Candidatus Cloacimonadota bacterium]